MHGPSIETGIFSQVSAPSESPPVDQEVLSSSQHLRNHVTFPDVGQIPGNLMAKTRMWKWSWEYSRYKKAQCVKIKRHIIIMTLSLSAHECPQQPVCPKAALCQLTCGMWALSFPGTSVEFRTHTQCCVNASPLPADAQLGMCGSRCVSIFSFLQISCFSYIVVLFHGKNYLATFFKKKCMLRKWYSIIT